ncbi:hypothetical protein ACQYWQ_00110 [Streptomyces sp. P6-2-1]|uniref:hypothetical protein n=1 Tax=unclassified Streptomyces TaxID=2593676 RepID=UPI003D3639EB
MFGKRKNKGEDGASKAKAAQQRGADKSKGRKRKSDKWSDQEKLTTMTSGIWSSFH